MKKIFALMIVLLMFSLQAKDENLISDPSFKKAENNWHLRKSKEYKSIKEQYKKGVFSFHTPSSSSKTYLAFYHAVELDEGESYIFSAEVKADGQGAVTYAYGTYGDLFSKKKTKKKTKGRSKDEDKGQNLGLMAPTSEFSSEWKTHLCYFTVKEKTSSLGTYMKILLGEYQGDFTLRNPQLIKVESVPSQAKKRGLIEVK
ncbi:hypothetical protein PQO01_10790 [Lentisphaera marina]|uniref:hypothetical protein n=1 Tax=Lentisphaera marina TaxID=1111041 RepID=UPI00236608F9|nr:hypothetical protein [Lentisphaera marina]MDD7985436.1 hypothetical protein [Lentisphaera marina]